MKCVSMLTVCGLFGVHSLGGMMDGYGSQESRVLKLYQLSATKIARNIKDLPKVGKSEIIDWDKVGLPNSAIKLVMEEVILDKDIIVFWLSNLVSLGQQKKYENRMFEALSEQGMPVLLDLELKYLASLVMQGSPSLVDKLNLSCIVGLLPSVTTNKKKQNPFPASVGRHQRFFNQLLVVNCNGMNASLDRDSGNLIIAYQDDIKLVIPTYNDDSKRATALRFNNDAGKFVAGFKGGKVRLYDTADNSEKEITEHSLAVTAVALSPDEDIVASASINGELCLSSISAGTHVKMWVDNLVSSISFEDNGALKLTMDRVVSRPIPLGSLNITDDQIVNKSVPLQYLKGKLTNKELLVAYIAKRIKDQNEELKHTAAAQLGLFMDTNKLFEPVMREYFRGIVTGKN